jgi:eukaryotic-like serine/threonine-protein kinase
MDKNILTLLKNKLIEYPSKNFNFDEIPRYKPFYNNIESELLQDIFSIFHSNLNSCFKFMNQKLYNRHYNAYESRLLISLIEELEEIKFQLLTTKYNFEIDPNYEKITKSCMQFLQESGGSSIPSDFLKISLVSIKPIFNIISSISVSKEETFIKEYIGGGSYADVYRYRDDFYNKYFATKKAKDDLTIEELKRFKTEFCLMEKLKSPYVIEVYNFNENNNEYVMEYADKTLYDYINENQTISIATRINLVKQILRAFMYIHSQDVLHRDISPLNVLLKFFDAELIVIKISDFGLVKLENSTLTKTYTARKGCLNDPSLDIYGFKNYKMEHETYALTRLIYFVMTGELELQSIKTNSIYESFVLTGIDNELDKRYKNIVDIRDNFNNLIQKTKLIDK